MCITSDGILIIDSLGWLESDVELLCSLQSLTCRKYYDLESYARRQAEKAAEKGETDKPRKSAAVTDEEALRQQRAMERQKVRYGFALCFLRASWGPTGTSCSLLCLMAGYVG
jgi:hypothetical protein